MSITIATLKNGIVQQLPPDKNRPASIAVGGERILQVRAGKKAATRRLVSAVVADALRLWQGKTSFLYEQIKTYDRVCSALAKKNAELKARARGASPEEIEEALKAFFVDKAVARGWPREDGEEPRLLDVLTPERGVDNILVGRDACLRLAEDAAGVISDLVKERIEGCSVDEDVYNEFCEALEVAHAEDETE